MKHSKISTKTTRQPSSKPRHVSPVPHSSASKSLIRPSRSIHTSRAPIKSVSPKIQNRASSFPTRSNLPYSHPSSSSQSSISRHSPQRSSTTSLLHPKYAPLSSHTPSKFEYIPSSIPLSVTSSLLRLSTVSPNFSSFSGHNMRFSTTTKRPSPVEAPHSTVPPPSSTKTPTPPHPQTPDEPDQKIPPRHAPHVGDEPAPDSPNKGRSAQPWGSNTEPEPSGIGDAPPQPRGSRERSPGITSPNPDEGNERRPEYNHSDSSGDEGFDSEDVPPPLRRRIPPIAIPDAI